MFSCSLHIALVGFSQAESEQLRAIAPFPKFTHSFEEFALATDVTNVNSFDAIFLHEDNSPHTPAEFAQAIKQLAAAKKPDCDLVIVGSPVLFDALCNTEAPDNFSESASEDRYHDQETLDACIHDFWATPLNVKALEFHYRHWLADRRDLEATWQLKQFHEVGMNLCPGLVWFKNNEGEHGIVNDAFCSMVGKTKEDIEGHSHSYVWGTDDDDPACKACAESDKKVLESLQIEVSEEVVHSNGEDRLLLTYKAPMYNMDGSVMGTAGVGIDITQERAFEQDLLEKNRSLESIFTSLDCGVLTHSHDGTRILGVNQTALDILGYESEEDLMEHGFLAVAPSVVEEDQIMLKAQMAAIQNVGDSISTQYRVRHDDGRIIHVMGNIKLIEQDGQLYYQRFLLDVTDQKIQEEIKERQSKKLLEEALIAANQANDAKSAFLLNMSHDIRTPMNAIVGFTALAAARKDDPEAVENYLRKIQASSDHLLELINNVLSMSRIEQGKVSLEETQCNIVTVVSDLETMFQAQSEALGISLTVNTDQIIHSEVYCDHLKLNQVLVNLLGNALKFTLAGGSIQVVAKELPSESSAFGKYSIEVRDTGIGMSADFIENIFAPFERERNMTISGIQGSGLGMAIVKNLMDLMDGTVAIESEVGKGSCFTVNLTLKLATEQPAAVPEKSEKPTIRGCHVLLVDDNMLNRELAVDLLHDAGFTVDTAEDGSVAVAKLEESPAGTYAVVLMDIQMPIMNGYEATRAIRALPDRAKANIPIFAVTADAFDEDRQKALDAGMNGHVAKPVNLEKLFETMESVLS